MHLDWSDQDSIAKALIEAYPETDRLSLSIESLKDMVTALPGFDGAAEPPKQAYLDAIRWRWMRLADPACMTGGGD